MAGEGILDILEALVLFLGPLQVVPETGGGHFLLEFPNLVL